MFGSRQEQHLLGHRRFPGIDVGDDADISQRSNVAFHGALSTAASVKIPIVRRTIVMQIALDPGPIGIWKGLS
jgi:hypothetical protein